MSVDGLVSGLSTSDLISQLMQAERQPQARLQQKRSEADKAISAYRSINTRFDALRTAADALATSSSWSLAKATSSDPDAVAVTASPSAATGRLTFTVASVASAHAKVSSGSVAGASAVVATGPLTITASDGTATAVDVGDGSLASVVGALNASSAGVRAAAVKVAEGQYRLQLTATRTGAGSAFSVDTTNLTPDLGTLGVLAAGGDAVLEVGDPATTGYEVRSASNTISDVLPGVTLTAKQAGATVTVDVAADGEGLADKVQGMVDAANAALSEISKQTLWQSGSAVTGPLVGDSTARRLTSDVLRAVSSTLGGASLADVGVELTRGGKLSFDRSAFLDAYAGDPRGVADRFVQRGVASDARVAFVAAGDRTATGTYGVSITQAASRASVAGTAPADGRLLLAETIEVSSGGRTARYDAAAGATIEAVADGLNAAFGAEGLGLVATVEGGALALRTAAYGSAAGFTVVGAGQGAGQTGLALGTYTGTDVAGSFTLADGTAVAGEGKGQLLASPADHATLAGLAVRVTATGPGDLGTVAYAPGLAQRLDAVATSAVDAGTGLLTVAIEGRERAISSLDERIANWDIRLELRESALRRQFSALEVALGKLQDQSNWLAGQIAGLPSYQ